MKTQFFSVCIGIAALAALGCGESADAAEGPCGIEMTTGSPRGGDGAGASPYGYLRDGGVAYGEEAAVWAGLPYSSITLERQACYGSCPVYSVELTRGSGSAGGAAEYRGEMHVDRLGTYGGAIDIFSYGRLCQLLDELGFQDFEENYAANWTDDSTVVLQATTADGPHRVQDYGRQGPPELFALQLAVDAIADEIEWTER